MEDLIDEKLKEFYGKWYVYTGAKLASFCPENIQDSTRMQTAYHEAYEALYEIKDSFDNYKKEKEKYIAKLEAQISRDRESLIKEGEKAEVLKKYLGNQKEWIND